MVETRIDISNEEICKMLDKQLKNLNILVKEPWYAEPPGPGADLLEQNWGYLIITDSFQTFFYPKRPEEQEIKQSSVYQASSESH